MIRHFWPVAVFCVLVLLTSLGMIEIVSQAKMNVIFIRLPQTPSLSRRSEVLRDKINRVDAEARRTMAENGANQKFGQAVGELGRLYQANQFYDQARSCYRLALEYDAPSALWFYLTASIHQQRGQTESMIGFLEQTLFLSSDYSPAVLKLADTHFKGGQMQKAKAYYLRRLELTPADPYAHLGLARIALETGQWAIAETELQKAILLDSQFGDAQRLMAQVHEYHGRIKDMQKSLALASKLPRFRPAPDKWVDDLQDLCYEPAQLLVLGSMALAALDMETALNKHFAKALEIDPENPEVHLAMGKAWLMAGNWSRAHGYLKRAIELDPTSDQAYFQMGLILQNQNSLPEAEAMMLKALGYQPNNANVLNNLGAILLEQGRYSDAIKNFEKALDIYPEHINARYNLGMSLWASGNSKAAVVQYEQILEIKPDWSMAANALAWILATDRDENVRDGDAALRWARIAIQGKHRDNPEYLDTLAAAFAECGQFEKAVLTSQRALSLAKASGDFELSKTIEGRLLVYQNKKPLNE